MISSLTLCNSRNTSSKISYGGTRRPHRCSNSTYFLFISQILIAGSQFLDNSVCQTCQTFSVEHFFLTCFILSRSKESVSLPPPPLRALHHNTQIHIHSCRSASQRYITNQQLTALTLKPLTCLQSLLGPMASLPHL